MNKDVIYIDVEDDITAIIGKVKSSKEKIVALVPPKRIGVLQSAVNLRLLQRMATQSDKRIVLITNNQALTALSAAASIPIAKNLQSKPEIAEIPALDIDNGEDVIDGSKLPVGDLADAVDDVSGADDADSVELIQGIDIDDNKDTKSASNLKNNKKSASKKVPDFSRFRKKLFILIGAGVLLVATLVWAFVFAPAATVIITARTTAVPVSGVVTLSTTTNAETGAIKATTQTLQKEASVQFEATGEKDVGEKATGTVRFTTSSPTTQTIAAGTILTTSGGLTFTLSTAVSLPGATLDFACGGICPGTANGTATASESGEKYNAATGNLTGAPSGVSARFTNPTGGGTSKVVPMVTATDVQAASEKLVAQSTDAIKTELEGKFSGDVTVISASFVADRAAAVSTPAVGSEASDKKATLTSQVTYRLTGVERSELETYLTQVLKKQMQDQTTQKVYKTGVDTATLNDYAQRGDTSSVRLVATGHIGPVIDESEIKEKVAGKRFGDIQAQLTQIEGVSDVQVKFSYFWVRTVPNDLNKIKVEFNVENATQ